MLAKKPVGGYTCASCENYLGELSDKANDFNAWNKYPARDTSDKAYKVRFKLFINRWEMALVECFKC